MKKSKAIVTNGAGELAKAVGSCLDEFLNEEGVFEKARARAIKEVVAWQLDQSMKKKKKISKNNVKSRVKPRTLENTRVRLPADRARQRKRV